MTEPTYLFERRRDGSQVRDHLWLYPELDMSSCIGDCDLPPGIAEVRYYREYLVERYPGIWQADEASISWSVCGDRIKPEYAPCEMEPYGPDYIAPPGCFSTYYTQPTLEGREVDLAELSVRLSRYPKFGAALRWKPTPFERTAHVRTIVTRALRLSAS